MQGDGVLVLFFFLKEVVVVAELAELAAKLVNFMLQVFHPLQHMPDGIDAFDIDGEVVIQMAIPFEFPELGSQKVLFTVDGTYFNKPAFFQGNQEGGVGMAFLAIFADNN